MTEWGPRGRLQHCVADERVPDGDLAADEQHVATPCTVPTRDGSPPLPGNLLKQVPVIRQKLERRLRVINARARYVGHYQAMLTDESGETKHPRI